VSENWRAYRPMSDEILAAYVEVADDTSEANTHGDVWWSEYRDDIRELVTEIQRLRALLPPRSP
jgi:hypothetical protein